MKDNELLEMAWIIIANAGRGDWGKESEEWQKAAAVWRGQYHSRNLEYLQSTNSKIG